jgi:phosphonate transport system substrate-binding protein
MDYLTANGPYRFELKLGTTYGETVEDLVAGHVAAAFLGTLIYAEAHERFGIVPILKPLNENYQPTFHVVVIARADSPIASIADLRGRTLALPSPESYSGNWLTAVAFKRHGWSASEFREVRHFEHHYTVVFQVLRGSFDAGVVKDRVAAEYLGRGIKVIARSEAVPGSPLVVAPASDAGVVAFLTRALLAVDPRKPEFRETVRDWDQEFTHGFTVASDDDYAEIRKLVIERGGR